MLPEPPSLQPMSCSTVGSAVLRLEVWARHPALFHLLFDEILTTMQLDKST